MRDVVAVPHVCDGDPVQVRTSTFANGEDVREALARMREVRKPIDHRHVAVACELLDRLMCVHSENDGVGHAAHHPSDVGDALAPTEAHLRGREIHAVAAELRRPDVERETRPEARLLEDESHGPPAQVGACGTVRLQPGGEVEQCRELVFFEVGERDEVANARRDGGHERARRRGRRSSTSRTSASATRAAS